VEVDSEKELAELEEEVRGRRCMAALKHMRDGLALDPGFLDKSASDHRRDREGNPSTAEAARATPTKNYLPASYRCPPLAIGPQGVGYPLSLWFLGGPQQDFAGERLRRLRH
jgi:hypothetical protein